MYFTREPDHHYQTIFSTTVRLMIRKIIKSKQTLTKFLESQKKLTSIYKKEREKTALDGDHCYTK